MSYRIQRRRVSSLHILSVVITAVGLIVGAGAIPFAALFAPFTPVPVVMSIAGIALFVSVVGIIIGLNTSR